MPDHRAITAVTEAVVTLLEGHFKPDDFGGQPLQFKVYQAKDFTNPMQAGVSVFLYRIRPGGTQRTVGIRIGPDSQRSRPQTPLELHFLLTAWAQEASLQHSIAGWMMRILGETPIFPAELLNRRVPNVFNPGETAEVVVAKIETKTLLCIWEAIVPHGYQISIPYIARIGNKS